MAFNASFSTNSKEDIKQAHNSKDNFNRKNKEFFRSLMTVKNGTI